MKYLAAMAVLTALLSGCAAPTSDPDDGVDMAQKDREIARLSRELDDARQRAADRDRQIAKLQALGPDRLERLFRVDRIRLGRFTGGHDIDGAPGHDGIKVYLEPIDASGSVLKAAGDVTIGLFDLTDSEGVSELGTFRFGVDQIAAHWFGGALTYHYSFVCPWGDRRPTGPEVTVRVTFVDHLTGKTFTAQTRCLVELPTETRPADATP